jgi:hypothetical protein
MWDIFSRNKRNGFAKTPQSPRKKKKMITHPIKNTQNKPSCKKQNKTSYKKTEGSNKIQTTQRQVSLYVAAKMR